MKKELLCWHCGGSLHDVPRPLRPSMRCPSCQFDLHVCRMCRYYDARYIGGCSHDRADKVLDKQHANYCTHFKPDPTAFKEAHEAPEDHARDELAALFGDQPCAPKEEPKDESIMSSAEKARRDANALFSFKPGSKNK